MSTYTIELYEHAVLRDAIDFEGPVEKAQAIAHESITGHKADFVRVIHKATQQERWAERAGPA